MKKRIVVLGAGFGGLELCTILSEEAAESVEITLIDKNDAFVIGYSKLDVLFGRTRPEAVRLPYARFAKPGVRFRQEAITMIDPVRRRVDTDSGTYDADVLVVALGADYDFDATPGLADGENEFYSFAGATRLSETLRTFNKGHAVVGVCGAPFKCPPAPSEAALLLHDYLTGRGVRDACTISLVLPLESPIPPSPETSEALLDAFARRGIAFLGDREIRSVNSEHRSLALDDGRELPCDLLLGVPKHRVPRVVEDCGLAQNGWIPVLPKTLATRFADVYAIGDVANPGTPKAGVFAESMARVVAGSVLAAQVERAHAQPSKEYSGAASCYIEFGSGLVGRVDIDFFSEREPTGIYHAPSAALRAEKEEFGANRRARWFNC